MFWITATLGTKNQDETDAPSDAIILDVRNLVDGTNPPSDIVPKLSTGYYTQVHTTMRVHPVSFSVVPTPFKLVVMCAAGVSRSNAIATGILTLLGMNFDDALNLVKSKVPRAQPNMDILDSVKAAVSLIQETHYSGSFQ